MRVARDKPPAGRQNVQAIGAAGNRVRQSGRTCCRRWSAMAKPYARTVGVPARFRFDTPRSWRGDSRAASATRRSQARASAAAPQQRRPFPLSLVEVCAMHDSLGSPVRDLDVRDTGQKLSQFARWLCTHRPPQSFTFSPKPWVMLGSRNARPCESSRVPGAAFLTQAACGLRSLRALNRSLAWYLR